MGYAYCGVLDGREIGYAIKAECDHPSCHTKIDRGMAYACGGHHLAGSDFCDRYFCYEHLIHTVVGFRCPECAELIPEENDYQI